MKGCWIKDIKGYKVKRVTSPDYNFELMDGKMFARTKCYKIRWLSHEIGRGTYKLVRTLTNIKKN